MRTAEGKVLPRRWDSRANSCLSCQGGRSNRKTSVSSSFQSKSENSERQMNEIQAAIYWASRAFVHLMLHRRSWMNGEVTKGCPWKADGKPRGEELGADDRALNESLVAAWWQWAGAGEVAYSILPRTLFRLTGFNKRVESFSLNAGNKVS